MQYVITYDIVGLILLVLLYVLNYSITNTPTRTTRLYRIFIISSFVGAFLDVFTIWTNHYVDTTLMLVVNNILAVIHISAVGIIPAVYYVFVLSITHELKDLPKGKLLFAGIVYGYDFITILTSPFTHLIMYYGEKGEYLHGAAFISTYIVIVFFIIAGIIELLVNYRKISRKQFYLVLSYTVIDIVVAAYQFMNPENLLLGFSSAISLMIISFALKNPMELVDNNVGVLNRVAFNEFLYTTKSNKGCMAVIHVKNSDSIRYMFGLDNGYNIIKKCIAKLLRECNQKLGFYIFEKTFIFIFKDMQEAQKKLQIIKKYKTTPLVIDNKNHVTFIDTDCYLFETYDFLKNGFDETSNKNSLDQIIDMFQFLVDRIKDFDGVKFVDSDFISYYKENLRIQKIVDDAIINEGFEVFLQPIYDLKTKKFTGAESLIRLRDADGKMISPGMFIPEAEKNGKILELGDISIKKTCEFIRDGDLQNLGISKVNINLSMIQCMQDDIVNHLISLLDAYNIPKEMIRFEITETMTTANPEKLRNMMYELAKYGIEFALDDYGTGYSNTSRLLTFPFSEIKFDKSFVDSAVENTRNILLLKHLMTMVKDTNMIVLVEGIETKEMSDLIEKFEGDLIQGFYYAKPLPLDEFVDFIKKA